MTEVQPAAIPGKPEEGMMFTITSIRAVWNQKTCMRLATHTMAETCTPFAAPAHGSQPTQLLILVI